MKAFYYCLINTTNDKRYHGSTLEISFRIGEHFQKLKNNKHPLLTLQEDFNLGHQFQVNYELLDKDEAIKKESAEISQDSDSYNLRNVPPTFKNKEKEKQLLFSLEDYYDIWHMIKNYNSVEFLRLMYGLPTRREVYKIYYFVEYALPHKEVKPITTHLPKREVPFEEWERTYNDKEKRLKALSIMEFLPHVRATIMHFMNASNGQYFSAVYLDPKRWPEEKEEYFAISEPERKALFIETMLDNNLFDFWLKNNKMQYSLKDIAGIYIFNNITIKSIKNNEREKVISKKALSRAGDMKNSKLPSFILELFEDGELDGVLYEVYMEMLEKCPTVRQKHLIAKSYVENPNIKPAEIMKYVETTKQQCYSVKKKQSLLNFLKEMPQHILSALPAG